MSTAFRCYFRKIEVRGLENIPEYGPILFLCNHPSSFMEPMLLACFQSRILNFLVRGDIFENKFLKPILEQTHQIPIYRARDGFENLRKNKSTFERVYQKLCNKECVLIFPESTTLWVRYLRPLQKGAAHISITSVKEYNLSELIVIPCGVNFTNVLKTGSDVFINIGQPIIIQQWINAQEPNADLSTKLTEHFKEKMLEVVYSIPSNISPDFYDSLSILYNRKDEIAEMKLKNHQALLNSIEIRGTELENKLIQYSGSLTNLEAVDFMVTKSNIESLLQWVRILFSFVLGIPSFILHGPLLMAAHKITQSLVKAEFKPPIRIVFSILVLLTVNLTVFIILWINYNLFIGFIFSLILYFSFFAMLYFNYNSQTLKFSFFQISKSKKLKLFEIRNSILKIIDNVKNNN